MLFFRFLSNMKSNYKRLGYYIRQVDIRNRDLAVTELLGLSIAKVFISSIANTIGTDMSNYKIVEPHQFGYGPVTSRNGDKITIALYAGKTPCLISQAYTVFEVIDENELMPEYLMMWFRRPEFDRFARFKSHGSAREIFDWETMCDVMLPVPSIEEQRKIVAEYQAVERRIENNRQMIAKLEETAQTIYRHMFVDNIDPENLPQDWRLGTIGEFCEIFTGKKDVNQSLSNGKYPFFSCAPEPFYSNEYIGKGPAVLIAGNGSYTGRVGYYDSRFDLYQRTYAIEIKKDSSIPISFIYWLLKSQFEPQYLGGSRGTSIPYIVRGDISDFSFYYNFNNIDEFEDIGANVLKSKLQIEKENRLLNELLSLLLSKLSKLN